ncbi:MAG TPA: biotin/lipoyl-containing protein, partial [Spirochaetia bacterium]|nr:biotin/lipoyl-containing protein [Spirochaetia bacterium]
MAEVIVMPKLGLTMERGTVLTWKKRPGDNVEKGEPLVEVETDKIINEVESPYAGTILKILVEEGTEVEVQTALALVGEPGEDIGELEDSIFSSRTGRAALQEPHLTADAVVPSDGPQGFTEPSSAQAQPGPRRRITPRAKKLLAEYGLKPDDLEELQKDRIAEADVK